MPAWIWLNGRILVFRDRSLATPATVNRNKLNTTRGAKFLFFIQLLCLDRLRMLKSGASFKCRGGRPPRYLSKSRQSASILAQRESRLEGFMLSLPSSCSPGQRPALRAVSLFAVLCLLLTSLALAGAQSQDQSSSQQQQKPTEQAPPEAGGPQGDIGPIAVPKKKEEPPPPPPPAPKKVPGMPDYSIQVNVPLVTLDVMALTKEGQFIPGLKKDNFKVFEDGVQQNLTSFNQSEAPITAVLLV